MKKTFMVILALIMVLSATTAFSDASPSFTMQPVDSTTDKNGNLSLTFKGKDYNPDKSSWHFVEPETGNEWTGPQLREEMKKRGVNGFKLTANDKKQALFLQKVPEFMHGWEVYVVLVNNNNSTESDHIHIYWYGLDRNTSKHANTEKKEKVQDSSEKIHGVNETTNTSNIPDEQLIANGSKNDGNVSNSQKKTGTSTTTDSQTENAGNSINITATKVFDYDAEKWMSAKELRAMLTILLFLDSSMTIDEEEMLPYTIANTSYTGYYGDIIVVAIMSQSEKDCLLIAYDTIKDEGEYSFMRGFNGGTETIEISLQTLCKNNYYKNNVADIKVAYDYLASSLPN